MASSASTDSVVKAGYWIFGKDPIRPVADIASELFTHLYAGFAEVNANDGTVTIPEQYSDQFRTFTETVRVRSPQVKTLLSIGGEGSPISPVVEVADKRQTFITTSIALARNLGFDGLDLCWLYPNSSTDNPDNLTSLLQGWRTAAESLLLTATVFHHPVIEGNITFNYPIQAINEKLDWINVLAVNFYTPSNSPTKTGPVHAWRNPREQNKCGSEGIYNWINGIDPNPEKIETNKLVLGLPFFGYKWTLTNSDQRDFFADANTATLTSLAFRNIQADYININIAGRLVNDHDMFVASYWHHEVTWIGFDDKHSIATKVKEAIRGNNLGGYFAWDLAADDDNWTLSKAASNAWDNGINNPGSTTTITTVTTNTGSTITTTTTTTTTAVSRDGEITKTVLTDTTTVPVGAASGEEDINNDTQTSDQNTRSRTSTTTTTTTTTTSATTTTTTATSSSTSSVNICNIL
ncbi:hypothetical protein F2P56_013634 [Juglans regia]|uniref:Class V chitinase-like n=2 Tax=Juglans regia TaxID=51240 RepID=A0A2I4H2I0_JUGRE|nr:class V chitinase-like [Juglans regia]XP_035546761.1 class V chitinase-like [Juglans regia]KAF5469570.1 hypothetical protein F2P56_013634 [Juglans regia]